MLLMQRNTTLRANSCISRRALTSYDATSVSGETMPPDYDAAIAADDHARAEDLANLTASIEVRGFVKEIWLGNIYRGRWTVTENDPVTVSLRCINLPQHTASEMKLNRWMVSKREIETQIRIWKTLRHPNVLQVYGYVEAQHPPHLASLVLPVITYESAMNYVKRNSDVDKDRLILGIAHGLTFLHSQSPPVIHGCLSAEAIQVTLDGDPLILDMGIRQIMDISHWKHNIRWMAPEIMMIETPIATTEGDVYSYALTSYEIVTELLPYAEYHSDLAVKQAVVHEEQRPRLSALELPPQLCSLWKLCWKMLPNDRPTMPMVLDLMESMRIQSPAHNLTNFNPFSEQRRRSILLEVEILQTARVPEQGVTSMIVINSFDNTQLSMLDITTGLPLRFFSSHRSPIRCITISHNHRIVSSAANDGEICVWNMHKGNLITVIRTRTREEHQSHLITSIFLSPTSPVIAAAQGTHISVYDLASSTLLHKLEGHSGRINDISISLDGFLIASASHDNSVKVWNMESKGLHLTLSGHDNIVRSVNFSLDSQKLASCSDDCTIKLWDCQSGLLLQSFDQQSTSTAIRCLAFSPDGSRIAVATGKLPTYELGTRKVRLMVIDIDSNKRLRHFSLIEPHEGRFHDPSAVAYSLDGTMLAVSFCDGKILIWNCISGELQHAMDGQITGFRNFAFTVSLDNGILRAGGQPLIF